MEVAAGNGDCLGHVGREPALQLGPVESALGQVRHSLVEVLARHDAWGEEHELAADHQDHLRFKTAAQPFGLPGGLAQLLQRVRLGLVEGARLDRHLQAAAQRLGRGLGQPFHIAAVDADPVRVQPVGDRADLAAHQVPAPADPAVGPEEAGTGVVGNAPERQAPVRGSLIRGGRGGR
jgi:hypothetical protein